MLTRAQTQYRTDIAWCETVLVCHRQHLEHQNIIMIACMLLQQVVGNKCTHLKSMGMYNIPGRIDTKVKLDKWQLST